MIKQKQIVENKRKMQKDKLEASLWLCGYTLSADNIAVKLAAPALAWVGLLEL